MRESSTEDAHDYSLCPQVVIAGIQDDIAFCEISDTREVIGELSEDRPNENDSVYRC